MGNSWLIRDFVLENASTTFDGCFLRLIEGFSSGLERIGNTQSSVNYFNRIIFDDTPTGEKQRIFFFYSEFEISHWKRFQLRSMCFLQPIKDSSNNLVGNDRKELLQFYYEFQQRDFKLLYVVSDKFITSCQKQSRKCSV